MWRGNITGFIRSFCPSVAAYCLGWSIPERHPVAGILSNQRKNKNLRLAFFGCETCFLYCKVSLSDNLRLAFFGCETCFCTVESHCLITVKPLIIETMCVNLCIPVVCIHCKPHNFKKVFCVCFFRTCFYCKRLCVSTVEPLCLPQKPVLRFCICFQHS